MSYVKSYLSEEINSEIKNLEQDTRKYRDRPSSDLIRTG